MSIRPLQDRIAVEPIEEEDTTAGGIIIPDTAKEKPNQGKVLAVGPGRKSDSGERITLDIKEGDTVLYSKWAGTELTLDGKTVLVMRESDVMGVIE
ncbi:chaperonin GroES [Limimonas halophila]|uniref:Co-chaperonin GroES n=1 Tax=Limimonas halophila TaxID=1082479 RepID=A0A1G7NDF0_9PROT|nr:co-chaperone GroES [Limimonas halophila]SDF71927.1 chaperonin GroES [Limimonas halophila]